MIEARTVRMHNYNLKCTATLQDNGAFEPSLVIVNCDWPHRPRVIAVRRGAHGSALGAIESAQLQGEEWVCNYGFPPKDHALTLAVIPLAAVVER